MKITLNDIIQLNLHQDKVYAIVNSFDSAVSYDDLIPMTKIIEIADTDSALKCLVAVKDYQDEVHQYLDWCISNVKDLLQNIDPSSRLYSVSRYLDKKITLDELIKGSDPVYIISNIITLMATTELSAISDKTLDTWREIPNWYSRWHKIQIRMRKSFVEKLYKQCVEYDKKEIREKLAAAAELEVKFDKLTNSNLNYIITELIESVKLDDFTAASSNNIHQKRSNLEDFIRQMVSSKKPNVKAIGIVDAVHIDGLLGLVKYDVTFFDTVKKGTRLYTVG